MRYQSGQNLKPTVGVIEVKDKKTQKTRIKKIHLQVASTIVAVKGKLKLKI